MKCSMLTFALAILPIAIADQAKMRRSLLSVFASQRLCVKNVHGRTIKSPPAKSPPAKSPPAKSPPAKSPGHDSWMVEHSTRRCRD
jgi:hypothetical protein